MKQLFREPLVHFLALGAALFIWNGVGGNGAGAQNQIVVTVGQVDRLIEGWTRTWQRPPTPQEVDGMIEDYVREEVLYREAMEMGLDEEDTIIRRRLRQKIEFLAEDLIETTAPTDDQLQEYLVSHPEFFRVEPRVSFQHIYISRDRRGEGAAAEAERLLEVLRTGGAGIDLAELGDPIPLQGAFESISERDVVGFFGEGFAYALMQTEVGRWTGPLESGYGLHLVFVREMVEGRMPELAEVREAVEREAAAARRRESNEAFYQGLRDKYTVRVELPSWAESSGTSP